MKSCLVCGGHPTPEQIEAHYRAKFDRGYYELARRYAPRRRHVYEELARWIAPRSGDRVLDIGTFTAISWNPSRDLVPTSTG